jgi:uncharacterized protein with NAD-binding domain and iron-sulfur cluster
MENVMGNPGLGENAAAPPTKQRIAILGGGIAALITAFELTSAPNAADLYDITFYQMGWRLGGKCATARGPNDRIEEHGIHGFLGCYYNALPMMVELYDALGRSPDQPLATFDQAFHQDSFMLMWEFRDSQWKQWPFTAPTNNLVPGSAADLSTVSDLNKWMHTIVQNLSNQIAEKSVLLTPIKWLFDSVMDKLLSNDPAQAGAIADLLQQIRDFVRKHIEPLIEGNDTPRRDFIMADYLLSLLIGTVQDDIINKGFDSIDNENFSDWLLRHGAAMITVSSPLALNTVNLSYQYPQGDTTRTALMAAGCYLHWSLRSFAYLGAFAWLFEAGTGETIIAPMYEVLKMRGVKFKFFHKVKNLKIDSANQSITEIEMDVQATLVDKAPGAEYQPLIDVKGLPAWPGHVLYEQVEQGQALKDQQIDLESYWSSWQPVGQTSIKAGQDFDTAVFAISIGAVPYLCKDILAQNSAWQNMVDKVTTVQTQTMQLWFDRTTKDLGYEQEFEHPTDTVIGATFVNPLDGSVDFTHLLKWENWPANGPQSLWYFSGAMDDYGPPPPFDDHGYPQRQYDRVKAQCIQYLQASIGPLLPKATTNALNPPGDPIGLDFSVLYQYAPTTPAALGTSRFDQQFWRANIDPTERYVTSPPGSTAARLKAWGSGYSNLVLAGDWIYTGLNVGSVEGTVMGGKLASHAISNYPPLSDIIGYPKAKGPETTNVGTK